MVDSKRPAPPPLVYRYPECGLCGRETSFDSDSFTCESCNCYWLTEHETPGEWNDPDEEFCGRTVQPYKDSGYENIRDHEYVCALALGHEGNHEGIQTEGGIYASTHSWRDGGLDG